MGQRARILTQIVSVPGFKVVEAHFEDGAGRRVVPLHGFDVPGDCTLVLKLARRHRARCGGCRAVGARRHDQGKLRCWRDLPWAGHPVRLEYAPDRLDCKACGGHCAEHLPWADPFQRQTARFQQHIALDAFSMPLIHVATKYGLSWSTVRRAETEAIARWDAKRPATPLTMVGVDEKWLGRRHSLVEKFVTIVSDLSTGVPLWIGYGRSEATLTSWLSTLTAEQKAAIKLFACDMHRPFYNAVRADPALAHAAIVHDAFHIMKRAGDAVTEQRRAVFFRAGPEQRAIGRGTRWLVLRPWERATDDEKARLRELFALNAKLARAYHILEELRETLRAPDKAAMITGLQRVLRRTERRANVPMRKLHDSIERHWNEIVALGEFRPPVGRIEALNNNWETLVRRARGYRDHEYLLLKLRFVTANPVRTADGVRRLLALGIPTPPTRMAA